MNIQEAYKTKKAVRRKMWGDPKAFLVFGADGAVYVSTVISGITKYNPCYVDIIENDWEVINE